MNSLPFSPEKPLLNVKLCKNCTHCQKAQKTCALYGRLNLIDGAIEYAAASVIRDKFCRDKYYEYYVDDQGRGDPPHEPPRLPR